MSNPEPLRRSFDGRTLEQETLFQLIASLANLFDKKLVIETVGTILDVEPVSKRDCVMFRDIALRFGEDGQVKSMYRVVDGSAESTGSGHASL